MNKPPSPRDQMFGMVTGFFVSQVTCQFARLNVAEAVGDGAGEAELAGKLGVDAQGGRRFLLACAGLGLLELNAGTYRLTELGRLLHGGTQGNLKSFAAAIPAECHWLPWGKLGEGVKANKSPVPLALGCGAWEYFDKHPREQEIFAGAMGDLSNVGASMAVKVYDFSRFEKIVDVGGSHGVVLTHLLRAAPKAKGVLFDLPKVVAGAGPTLERAGIQQRVEVIGGDFFAGVPAGGDLYVMKHIIHDWEDVKAEAILRNCASAARPGAMLVLLEIVMPNSPAEARGPMPYLMDLNMLVMVDGKERTEREYRELLARAGWRLTRIVPTEAMFFVIEAVKQ